jgi:hypothetical protein
MKNRLGTASLALILCGCRYGLNPDVDPNRDGGGFTCASDADCGSGWHCNLSCQRSDFTPYCLPNGECDPCPNLDGDSANCGKCGNACAPSEECFQGQCVPG